MKSPEPDLCPASKKTDVSIRSSCGSLLFCRAEIMSVSQNNHAPNAEQIKAAIELLEKASANRALLAGLSDAEHTRLMKAAGDLYCPDVDPAPPAGESQSQAAQGGEEARRRLQAAPDRHPQTAPRKRSSPRRIISRRRLASRGKSRTIPISTKPSSRRIVTSAKRITRRSIISTTSFARRARN